jgi:hypothetical protein
MASAAELLSSPDYLQANPATKQAIFDKHIAADAAYVSANPATQEAIRQRFGLGAPAAPPATAPPPKAPAEGGAAGFPRYLGEGVMGAPRALMALPAGILRGVTDVTDTATLLGARATDALVPRGQVLTAPSTQPSMRRGLDQIMPSAPAVPPEAPTSTRAEDVQAYINRRKAEFNKEWGDQAPADVGRFGGQVFGTLPIGGFAAAPVKAAAIMAPSLARFLTPVATALETGGFKTGITGAGNVAAKVVGGGVGGGLVAEAIEPGSGETGAAIGAAVPTIAAPLVKGVYNYGRRVLNPKDNALLDMMGGEGRDITNALRDPDARIVPGSAPNAGEVASTVGSSKLSAAVEDVRSTPAFANERAAQDAQNNQARLAQDARVQSAAETARQKSVSALTARIDSNLVTENPDALGAGLKAIAQNEKKALKPIITQAYEDAFAIAPTAKIDIGNVVKKAEQILGQPLADIHVPDLPDIAKKLLKLKGGPTTEFVRLGEHGGFSQPGADAASVATLREVDALRAAINADIASARAANASPGQATRLRELGQLHKAIDDAVGNSAALPDEAKTAYANAVAKYRTEYAPRFKEGVNAQVLAKGSWNQDAILAEDVIKKYFSPGGATEAKQFVTLFGGNAPATKIARAGIEDLYRQKVTDAATGAVDSGKHAAFMKDYARPLAILDDAGMGLKNKFAQIGEDARRLEDAQKLVTTSGNKLGPPLPGGSNALATQTRIDELTRGLNPAQLTAVDAVRKDLARAAEHQRLASAGAGERSKQALMSDAVEIPGAGAVASAAIPGKGRVAVGTIGYIFKKLTGAMDDKLALDLARVLSNPTLAANAFEGALSRQGSRETRNALFSRYGERPTGIAASQLSSNPNAGP